MVKALPATAAGLHVRVVRDAIAVREVKDIGGRWSRGAKVREQNQARGDDEECAHLFRYVSWPGRRYHSRARFGAAQSVSNRSQTRVERRAGRNVDSVLQGARARSLA